MVRQAQTLAGRNFQPPKSNLPSQFREMKFADYQQIQFNYDKAYWSKLKTPFKLEFYHQGMYFDTPVKINEVTATRVKEIKYSPKYFSFGSGKHDPETLKDLGFAGFKILDPIKIWTIVTICAQVPGSNRVVTGARVRLNWWRSR